MKYFIALLLLWSGFVIANAGGQPRWDGQLDFSAIEKALATEDVLSEIPMQDHLKAIGHQADFEGDVYFVTLKNGVQGVFKPYPPTDYPDAYAEVSAYKAARFMGLRLVPPTVLRKIKGRFGSFQFYVTPTVDALIYTTFDEALAQLSQEDQQEIKLFYFLFGQWDYGPHNIILQKNKGRLYPALIDNTGIKHHQKWRLGEHPFVRVGYFENLDTNDWWGVPFPLEKSQVIKPDIKAVQKRFGKSLSPRFQKKLSQAKYPIHYILWRDSFWRQFHKEQPKWGPLMIEALSQSQRDKIKHVTEKVLNEIIFPHARKADFYQKTYREDIIARKNMLLSLPTRP